MKSLKSNRRSIKKVKIVSTWVAATVGSVFGAVDLLNRVTEAERTL